MGTICNENRNTNSNKSKINKIYGQDKNISNNNEIKNTQASSNIINCNKKFESENKLEEKEDKKENKKEKNIKSKAKVSNKEKKDNQNNKNEKDNSKKDRTKQRSVSESISNLNESKIKKDETKEENKNEKIKNSINNIKTIQKEVSNPYSDLDENKSYYLTCPKCKERAPHIEKIKYDSSNNDFMANFKCNCFINKESDFSLLKLFFSEDKPLNLCNIHDTEVLIYYCQNCKKSFCKLCKSEHTGHKKQKNKFFISKENIEFILKTLEEIKNVFGGTKLIKKTFERYLAEFNEENISLEASYQEEQEEEKEKEQKLQYSCFTTMNCFYDRVISLIELKSGWLAASSYDKKMIYIWICEDNFCVRKIQEKGYALSLLEFEPKKILSGTSEGNICLRKIFSDTNKEEYNFEGHDMSVNCLIKINEKYFASGSNDCTIHVWDYYERKEYRILIGHTGYILSLIILNNGNLCSGGQDLTIKFWDWENALCLKEIKAAHTDYIKCLCQFNDNYLISGAIDKTIKIWDNCECVKQLNEHKDEIKTLCKIDENYFASGSNDNTIKIWDIRNFSCIQTLKGHSSNVCSIIKLTNNCLASCSLDKTIKIWKNI